MAEDRSGSPEPGEVNQVTWLTPEALIAYEKYIAQSKGTRAFTLASNDAKLLFITHQRLVETLLYGEPKTEMPGLATDPAGPDEIAPDIGLRSEVHYSRKADWFR